MSQDYAQLSEGRLKLHYDSFDPRTVVQESVAVMSLEAKKKGVELAMVLDQGLPEYVTGSMG